MWNWIAFIAGLTPLLVSTFAAAAGPPNFVVIFIDDLGYADVSCFGGKHVSTPKLDQMAAEGIKLTSFYAAASVCTPSRAALMTGCYPKRIDIATGSTFHVLLAGDAKGLNPNEITIAEVLKAVGYKTGIFGKWHLGDQPQFLPTRQGFDEFFGLPYSHDIHPFHPQQMKFHFPPLPLLDGEKVIETDPNADELTRRITERAVHFIETNNHQPFFLYVPHPMPHAPLHVSPPFMNDVPSDVKAELAKEPKGTINYDVREKLFRQVVAEIDWSVGQILSALKAQGLDDNTLVIFTSDNGADIGSAAPLRGKKGSVFEGGMREPAIVRWPGHIPAGLITDEIVTEMDLLPTFAKLAGAAVAADRKIDGKDIWPVLSAKGKSPHKAFFYFNENELEAVRSGKWKLFVTGNTPTALFDLSSDIGESRDLLQGNESIAATLLDYATKFKMELAQNSRPAAYVDNPKPLSRSDR